MFLRMRLPTLRLDVVSPFYKKNESWKFKVAFQRSSVNSKDVFTQNMLSANYTTWLVFLDNFMHTKRNAANYSTIKDSMFDPDRTLIAYSCKALKEQLLIN